MNKKIVRNAKSRMFFLFLIIPLIATTAVVPVRANPRCWYSQQVPVKTMVAPEKLTIPIVYRGNRWGDNSNHRDAIFRGIDKLNTDFFKNSWFRFEAEAVSLEDMPFACRSSEAIRSLIRKWNDIRENGLTIVEVQRLSDEEGALIGLSTYPWDGLESIFHDRLGQPQFHPGHGIIIERKTNWDYVVETRTFPHEIGHWLGLFHPWDYGVNALGDEELFEDAFGKGGDCIADTPCMKNKEYFGCDFNRNSCIDYGNLDPDPKDPIDNVMMYTKWMDGGEEGNCMRRFTDGQKHRMVESVLRFRYELLPDTTDLSLSSHFQGSSGTVVNGYAVAHETIMNSGNAVVGPDKEISANVIAHSNGKIVLTDGFHAMYGSTFRATITNGVNDLSCTESDTMHFDCEYGTGEDWLCIDKKWIRTNWDCDHDCVPNNWSDCDDEVPGMGCCFQANCINGRCVAT